MDTSDIGACLSPCDELYKKRVRLGLRRSGAVSTRVRGGSVQPTLTSSWLQLFNKASSCSTDRKGASSANPTSAAERFCKKDNTENEEEAKLWGKCATRGKENRLHTQPPAANHSRVSQTGRISALQTPTTTAAWAELFCPLFPFFTYEISCQKRALQVPLQASTGTRPLSKLQLDGQPDDATE